MLANHMVEYNAPHLDVIFHALADPTRRAMLHRLIPGEQSVSDLATPFNMSLAGASKHIKVLESAGLVRRRIEGRTHLCRLEAARLADAERWLATYRRFWSERLDDLEALLREEDATVPKVPQNPKK